MSKSVRQQSAAVAEMEKCWAIVRPLLGGTSAMREAGKRLLPMWPMEEQAAYDARLAAATLFPAYSRTVSTLSGKPFSKALSLGEDVPSEIQEWSENINLQGVNLHSFAADVFETAMGHGISGILVEFPKTVDLPRTDAGQVTKATEDAAGIRPYMTHIKPWSILGWRSERVNGADVLTQLRILESVNEPDGEFGESAVEQVRVFRQGSWEVWREKQNEWFLFDSGVTTIPFIPFVPVYGQRTGYMTGKPPLIEMAHLNIEHWQSSSDQRTIMHVARVPILTMIGAEEATVVVGASSAIKLPIGAEMRFVEHSGAAISAGRESLLDLEEQMRQAGAELLVLQPGKVTATQIASENAVGMCALQRMAQDFEDAIDLALDYMARWVNISQGGGHCSLFMDFGAATLSDASAQLLLQANQSGKISNETLMAEWKRRGIISPDIDFADEQERIDNQGPALGLNNGDSGQ